MKVFQAMAGAAHGGAEAFFTRLVLGLHHAGLEQKVAVRPHPERVRALKNGGVEPVTMKFGGPLDLMTRWALRREIAAFKPDVVLTWMNRASGFCPKSPVGGHPFVHVGRLGGYYNLDYYRGCDHLIGNTEDIVEYLSRQGWPAEKAHYLPNFVSAETMPPLARKEFFTPRSAPLILALGRLHRNKGFDVLLEALTYVPDAYLWLAGEGPEREALEAQAQKLGIKPRVRFLGWREDTAALFAAADLFVCSSRHEPLGNVVIEAWAQGVPVVSADSEGPGTLIQHEESGILVPTEDAKALGLAVRWVLSDEVLSAHLARQGRAAFDARFTEDVVVRRYLDFFDKITAEAETADPPAEEATD